MALEAALRRSMPSPAAVSAPPARRSGLVLLLLVLLVSLPRSSASPGGRWSSEPVALEPEQLRRNERVPCGSTQLYRVQGLKVDAVYDVKLSYPATIPTDFDIQVLRVIPPLEVAETRRRVLNTAKLRLEPRELLLRYGGNDELKESKFELDPSAVPGGRIAALDGTLAVELAVTGQVEGVSRVIDLENRECVFDIVIEELVFGAIPRASFALIAWLVVVLVVAAKFVFPFLVAKISLQRPEDREPDKQS